MEHSIAKDENHVIAKTLSEVADLLKQQHASGFRVGAYRAAADRTAPHRPFVIFSHGKD